MLNQDYFNKQQTESLKGLMAVLILIHHIYQHVLIGGDYPLFDFIMRSLGYYAVSIFLFISGYGLMLRYQATGGGILRDLYV